MSLVGLLWPLVSLVTFAAFIWLVVVAFKRSVLWGLLVLFLSPIAAVIFAIKNWQESKKPFLVYAASTTLSVVLFVYSFSALGGFAMLGMANRMANGEISEEEAAQFMQEQMERMENSGMLSAEEEAELRQMQKLFQDMQEEQGVKTAQEPTTPRPSVTSAGGSG
jgi:hypothetical protein